MKPRHNLFFTAASDLDPAAGLQQGAAAAPEAPAAEPEATELSEAPLPTSHPAPGTASADADANREPTLLERASAAVKSKGALLAENNDLRAKIHAAKDAADFATTELQRLTAENAQLAADLQARVDELAAIEAALKSTEEAAADIVATTVGIPAESLPESAKPGETVEELQAQLAAEKDNDRRYEIASRIARMQGIAVVPSAN